MKFISSFFYGRSSDLVGFGQDVAHELDKAANDVR